MECLVHLGDVNEKTNALYKAVIRDEEEEVVPVAQIGTLTLTLYDATTEAIVNSRDHQNVLNLNGGTVDAQGNFAFVFLPADTTILAAAHARERRVALFEWTFAGGTKQGRHEMTFSIRNLKKVS